LLRRRALLALALALTAAAALLVLGTGSARAAGTIVVPKFKNVSTKAGVAVQEPDATCGAWVTGAAWGDVNADGWPDLYVARLDQPTELFLNNRHGGFSGDVAAKYSVQTTGATGVVFADYDNDGRPDLYVVREGPDVLYHNDGHGHFSDVTAQAGISDNYFGSSVSFADFNNDGYLDIYVTNYAQCGYPSSSLFNYQPDKLYQNNGNGTFTDVTSLLGVNPANGLGLTTGAGFQAAWFDALGNGRQDLYLGNDYFGPKPDHNRFFMNMGPGSDGQWQFQEDSVPSGTAYSMNTMGIAIGDFNNDLKLDVALSNIRYNRLLENKGNGIFDDLAVAAKVDRRYDQVSDQVPVTWGTAFYDFNLDGWEDLYFAAGNFRQALDQSNGPQPNMLFVNKHDGTFADASHASGSADPGSTKGVAFADYNRDGRMDMYVVNQGGVAHLFENVTPMGKRHWLEVKAVGTKSNRDACGARLILKTKAGSQLREVFCGSTSVASGSQEAVLFGLGQQTAVQRLTVLWPSGKRQIVKKIKIDGFLKVVEPK
jgi:hypothetical protein